MFGSNKRFLREYFKFFKELKQLRIISQRLRRANEVKEIEMRLKEKEIIELRILNINMLKMIGTSLTDDGIINYYNNLTTKIKEEKGPTLIK